MDEGRALSSLLRQRNCLFDLPARAVHIGSCEHGIRDGDARFRGVLRLQTEPATGAQIDDDRERFLKELKSQAFASHTQINAAATFRCVLEHQHSGATEPAAVCHSCYGEARQQADRLEAALHMDAKEAAKIVYEAVWADTSDPNTTYLNAATALLSELRNRAGIGLLLGANQPLAH